MRKLFTLLALVLMVLAGNALAAEKGQVVPNPDPQFEHRPLQHLRTDLVNESFEDMVPPSGWSNMTSGASYTWTQSDAQAYSGAYCAWLQWGGQGEVQDEWLITPALDTSGFETLYMEFMETGFYWADYGVSHEILISTTTPDDPANFTSVWQVTPSDYAAPWLDASGSEWGQVSLALDEYIGETIYIALRYQGEWADDWWIDDFRVFQPFEHDIKALAVTPDNQIWMAGQDVIPQFTVKNIGSNVETFTVEMDIQYNSAPFYTESVTVEDLGLGAQVTVEFPAFMASAGAFDMTGTAILESDNDPDNNMAMASNGCYTGERNPFGMLFTEWGCGPCVGANQAMDVWYPEQGNESSMIRVHMWWPAGDDPMYFANVEQAQFLHSIAGVDVWGVPCLLYDNTGPSSLEESEDSWEATIETFAAQSAATAAPLEMNMVFDQENNNAMIMVDVLDPMSTGDYALYVAVTEDHVNAEGPNGEAFHSQTFRWLYPNTEGLPVANEVGYQEFVVPLELNEDWVYQNLRATAFVIQMPGGMVQNSATLFLNEGTVGNEDDNEITQDLPNHETRLTGAHPNPFNPMTQVSFSVARDQKVKLSVFDMAGKRVVELTDEVYAAGEYSVPWNGKDSSGHEMSSGTYMVYMETDDAVTSSKMTLVR